MIITALNKFTALDFPGHLACIIFTGGCNLRCGYCHNGEFVLPEKLACLRSWLPFEAVKNFLISREGLLEGVVICGGEPTVQPDLLDRLAEIKALGYAIKLDTNGSRPGVLAEALKRNLIDYVAMDIKDALPYRKVLVGTDIPAENIRESIKIIMNSPIDYEFRSTILPSFHNQEVLDKMAKEIQGAKKWVWQKFRNQKTLNSRFNNENCFSDDELNTLIQDFDGVVGLLEWR